MYRPIWNYRADKPQNQQILNDNSNASILRPGSAGWLVSTVVTQFSRLRKQPQSLLYPAESPRGTRLRLTHIPIGHAMTARMTDDRISVIYWAGLSQSGVSHVSKHHVITSYVAARIVRSATDRLLEISLAVIKRRRHGGAIDTSTSSISVFYAATTISTIVRIIFMLLLHRRNVLTALHWRQVKPSCRRKQSDAANLNKLFGCMIDIVIS